MGGRGFRKCLAARSALDRVLPDSEDALSASLYKAHSGTHAPTIPVARLLYAREKQKENRVEYLIHEQSLSSSFALADPKLSQGCNVHMDMEAAGVGQGLLLVCTKGTRDQHLHFQHHLLQCSS